MAAISVLSSDQNKGLCGVLVVEILDGTPGTLNTKEKYVVNTGFSKGLTEETDRRTSKCPTENMVWNKKIRVPLIRKLTKEDQIVIAVLESGWVHDEKVGFGVHDLAPLWEGQRLDSTAILINDKQQQEICRINIRVSWENDNVPDMGQDKVSFVRGNASQQAIDLNTANKDSMPAAPVVEIPKTEGNDYSVRIRVHKARNLQSTKEDTLYDPLVSAVIDGETKSTDYAEETNNPIWDDELVFTFEKVGADWLNNPILIKVQDHHIARPNSKIGSLQLDLATAYQANEKHVLEHKWHVLHRDTLDGHVVGFIKLSIWVGDMRKDPCPEPTADNSEDEDDIVNNLISGPGARFEEITLHADVFRAEDIPQMDISLNPFQKGTADPFVKFQFGTRLVQTNYIKESLTPVWNTTVQLPMLLPSLTNNLTVGLWDDDTGSADDLISQNRIPFRKLLANGKAGLPYFPAQFVNFYGGPRDSDADFNKNYKAMAKGDREGLDYRGRMLLRMAGSRTAGQYGPMANIAVHETKVDIKAAIQVLQLSMCPPGQLEVKAYVGLNQSVTNTRQSIPMKGSNLCSSFFGEEINIQGTFSVILPSEEGDPSIADQLPDIIVHLCFRGKSTPFAALRFPANQCIDNNNKSHPGQYVCKNMEIFSDPGKKSQGEQPTDPLIQCVFAMGIFKADGYKAESVPLISSLVLPAISAKEPEEFKLECCVFQARQLPAGDDNGLSDPFIRITWANGCAQSGTKQETLNPIFNEFLVVSANAKQRFPDIVVEVWDWDFFGSNTFLCKKVIPFADAEDPDKAGQTRWYKGFTDSKGKYLPDCELLLNFEVAHVTERNRKTWDNLPTEKFLKRVGSGDTYTGLKVPKDKAIPQAIYKIDCSIFALRHMRSYHLMAIKCPSITAEIAGHTVELDKVYGNNPDFNRKFDMYVELPENPDYLPHLNFRVFENRFGPSSMVGTTSLKIDGRELRPEVKKLRLKEKDDAVAQRRYKVNEFKGVQQMGGPGAPLIGARVNAAKFKAAGKLALTGAKTKRRAAADGDATTASGVNPNSELYETLLKEQGNEPNYDSIAHLGSLGSLGGDSPGSTRNTMTGEDNGVKEMSDKKEEERLSSGELLDNQINSLFAMNEEEEERERQKAEAEEKKKEEEERLWFDRFDPEGLNVPPEYQVSRFGKVTGVTALNHSTLEDYYGPFDDEITPLKLWRGWGKERTVAGHILVDVTVETVKNPPPGIQAAATATPTPGKSDADAIFVDKKIIEDRQPTKYVCHVYIISCTNLAPMDDSILGKMSDPYPVLQLMNQSGGKKKDTVTLRCKDDCKYQTLNPEFFVVKELNGMLPKQDTLKISIYDYDKIGRDELIGFTEIDLESRWHSRRGYKYRNMTTLRQGVYTETRQLRNELGQIQGQIEMWVDMYDVEYQKVPFPLDIAPPPPVPLELRAVVWNTRDVIMQEESIHGEAMTDIYVRCWLDGMNHDTQSTDVHYRSLDGNGNFNWRMKFPFVFEPRTRKIMPVNSKTTQKSFFHVRREQKKFEPVLRVQIWDNDLLPGTDDFIGEAELRLMDLRPTTTKRDPETLIGIIGKEVSCCCNCFPFNQCCTSREQPPEHMLTLKAKQERAAAEARHDREVQETRWRKTAKARVAAIKESHPEYTELQLQRMEATQFNELRKNAIVSIFKPYMPTAKKKKGPEEDDDNPFANAGQQEEKDGDKKKDKKKSKKANDSTTTGGGDDGAGEGEGEEKSFFEKAKAKFKKDDDDDEGDGPRNKSDGKPGKKKGSGMPDFDDLPKATETPKYWFACRGPNGGGRIGDVQISFQIVRADLLEGDKTDTSLLAGAGRSQPNRLPEPNRPDSSFFWLSSPWKSAVFILWKNYKWYIITILCLGILAALIFLFVAEGDKIAAQRVFAPVDDTPAPHTVVILNISGNNAPVTPAPNVTNGPNNTLW